MWDTLRLASAVWAPGVGVGLAQGCRPGPRFGLDGLVLERRTG
ncbi:hypothetical protein [Streptomyces flaveolus]